MNSCRASALQLASSTPRVNTISSIGTGAANGSVGETRLLGSVTGRSGVGISATAAEESRSAAVNRCSFIPNSPSFSPLEAASLLRAQLSASATVANAFELLGGADGLAKVPRPLFDQRSL